MTAQHLECLWLCEIRKPSLRGAKRRSNPFFLYAARWIASLALAMTAQHLDCLWLCEIRKPSLRGATATKQSMLPLRGEMDCFAEPVIGRAFARPRVEPHCLHQTPGQRVERNSEAYSANSVSLIFLQNRGRVHLQSAKHQRSDGFSDVMLIKAYSRISKLYEAGEKTQNL